MLTLSLFLFFALLIFLYRPVGEQSGGSRGFWQYPRFKTWGYPDYNTCRNYIDSVCRFDPDPVNCYGWVYNQCRSGLY